MTDRTAPQLPAATILGYPRIGPRRELKRVVEAFWAGHSELDDLEAQAAEQRRSQRTRLVDLGLAPDDASIPSDFSYYDQVLDAAVTLGAVPPRFAHLLDEDGALDLPGYFTLARGEGDVAPLEMTKWFDTNYHYLVPEIGPRTEFRLADDRVLRLFLEGATEGVTTRPVVVGPVTFLLLSKAVGEQHGEGAAPATAPPAGFTPLDRLEDLLPVYVELLRSLGRAGAPWVQLDEPALAVDWDVPRERVLAAAERAYAVLATETTRPERPALFVPVPYGSAEDALPVLARAGVEAVGLDLVRGAAPSPEVLAQLGDAVVVAGAVDGRNVWRTDLDAALARLRELEAGLPDGAARDGRLCVTTSTSLQHVPYDVGAERALDPQLRSWLAFADQKVEEVLALATALTGGPGAASEAFRTAADRRRSRFEHPGVRREDVRRRVAAIGEEDVTRADFAERAAAQAEVLDLPPLPTTTIGSFPQTSEIRSARARHRAGDLSEEEYTAAMRAEIERVVRLQEELGLDVLVHGEPERNDMVQYFAEQLEGFAATEHGWVQSYGTRCTRPSILWGDVARPAPITVEWTRYAASLTDKPVKGMLTGPVTILAWSFVRDDQPPADTAAQVALALREEVADLEAAGIGIIQVDEPALRELLPLRAEHRPAYLDWSVRAFRIATAVAGLRTQVHTHLCYSEFGDVIDAIDALDADVTSIEAARSRMEVLPELHAAGFARGVGPGVYDIHSPRVPSEDEVAELVGLAAESVHPRLLWVNPDCGLKTRRYEEVEPALRRLVAAAGRVRARL
ncbi:5-methyltetrahydropteroyltriglutamate--homocysteine S-methyltransferase [Georgenia sp. 311]|uniref:5-methyltetrahydropteroyltriglutamate-- homocysteine S-methyltransferase n=1 Tax=Georgenia sp. 311 TaxID=2585134 RepID=UPI00111186FA|nr:5-methyltetrahydropteroyltriglutamate--homocysteine S-methyltransferase [Georgenia sp. 311]TNC17948.1 5-methyltetrahydropteroyltriglutamate--homocysteine S-methyltransferase [Georgenia sp. 311]